MAERSQDQHVYDNDGELILTGSANAYVAATARPITGYFQGLKIRGKANFTNSGAATLNVNGMGAAAIRKSASTALVSGDIVSGKYYTFIYDTTTPAFQVMEVPVPANGTITNAMLADMAQSTVKGRAAGAGTGAPQDLTAAQTRTAIGAVNIAGDTMTGLLAIQVGDAVTRAEYLRLIPSDHGTNKPYIAITKGTAAEDWEVLLWDGADTNGNINFLVGGLLWNGATIAVAPAWATYTPTISAETGAFTTVSATGRHMRIGKILFIQIEVTITTNGTAAGSVVASLPVNAVVTSVIAGQETGATAVMLQGRTETTNLRIRRYDGVYPGASGRVLSMSGCYEVA